MKKKIFTALGLMTGTSMDGIDLSIIKSDGYSEFTPILNVYCEFDKKLRNKLVGLRDKIFTIQDLETLSKEIDVLDREITIFHNEIINYKLKDFYDQIDLIGFHGQTIFHNSKKKISKQLGNGQLLSQLTKKIVINDFRQQDLTNDGQGAPLAPIFHKLITNIMFKKSQINFPINIVNIGGITNITHIFNHKYYEEDNFYAYDIGPGNCLIDEWIRRNSKKKFDENGNIANSGKVNDLILNQAIENFSNNKYDKSLDVKDFDTSFVKGLSIEDGCATVTKFTAFLISQGIEFINSKNKDSKTINLICGGGRKNNFLMKNILDYLKNSEAKLYDIDNYGFDGDFIESQTFGFLAIRTLLKLPISFPSTTRCKNPTIGGIINKNF